MKIYSPVLNFNGIRCNVRFVKGVGESADPDVIDWFKARGYTLEDHKVERAATIHSENVDTTEPIVEDERDSDPRDYSEFEKMTPMELREWMRTHGYAGQIKNTRNKEKLLKILKG